MGDIGEFKRGRVLKDMGVDGDSVFVFNLEGKSEAAFEFVGQRIWNCFSICVWARVTIVRGGGCLLCYKCVRVKNMGRFIN